MVESPVLSLQRSPFATPFITIMKTMTMSEGEFDFDVNFAIDQGGTTPSITYPITSFFLWLVFLVLMSILLTNLLVRFQPITSVMHGLFGLGRA